jgi:hypothetical protein
MIALVLMAGMLPGCAAIGDCFIGFGRTIKSLDRPQPTAYYDEVPPPTTKKKKQ